MFNFSTTDKLDLLRCPVYLPMLTSGDKIYNPKHSNTIIFTYGGCNTQPLTQEQLELLLGVQRQ